MLAEILIRRFLPGGAGGATRAGMLEGWVSVVVNLVVFAVKVIPGLLIGSVSLVADGFHSLGDLLTSAVVIWSFRASAKPPDREHPFGHGRIESVASLVIAVLLLVGAVEFARSSVASLLHPHAVEASWPLLVVLAVTIVLKEWLARFSSLLARRITSTALEADAWHHHSDALATLVVVLALAGERFGVRWLDGAAGLAVAGVIAWSGLVLVRRSFNPLIGEAAPEELKARIRELALADPLVDAVHDVMVHAYGRLLILSLHVEVPVDLDVVTAHDVAEAVEKRLAAELGAVAVVHVDPVDRHHPLYGPVQDLLAEMKTGIPGFLEFHDLRIVGGSRSCNVVFDASLEGADTAAIRKRVADAIRSRFPQVANVVIEVEPTLAF